MTEENKTIARKVYEIISAGNFDRAEEIVDREAPDNELLPGDPPAKLIDTFKATFEEARGGFPDLHVTVEDLVAEGDRVTARVTMRGTHQGVFQGLTPTGKRVEGGTCDGYVPHLRWEDRGALGPRRRPNRLLARERVFLSLRETSFHDLP